MVKAYEEVQFVIQTLEHVRANVDKFHMTALYFVLI